MSGISKRVSGSWVSGDYGIMKTATDTITTLPADIYADGNNATVGISGNTVQNGTPTPDSPIMPQGTGEKTGNLFDGQLQQGYYTYMTGDYALANSYVCTHLISCTENTTYTFRCINTGGGSKNYGYVFFDSAQNRIDSDYINVLTEGDVVTHTATTPQNTAFLAINIAYGRRQASVVRPSDITDFMLNLGSTPLPYEPYGYKIPISSSNTTTPVYLGEAETTRKIKKLVLTGNEPWQNTYGVHLFMFQFYGAPFIDKEPALCTEYMYNPVQSDINTGTKHGEFVLQKVAAGTTYVYNIGLKNENYSTVEDFKLYLQQQYAAGTPVTVWYVLATPQTTTVNEPLMKIGDYADSISNAASIPTADGANTITVDTTVQPSEFTATWTGWHDASVKEWDGSQWNE